MKSSKEKNATTRKATEALGPVKGEPEFAKANNASVREGQKVGEWLIERAPHVLLTEFSSRKVDGESPATRKLNSVLAALNEALGPAASNPDVLAALHELDSVIWDIAVEHEDCAWFAAWTLAMSLRGRRD